MKQTALIKALRAIKNELDDDAKGVAVAIEEAITEAENSDEIITATDLSERIRAILPKEVSEDPEVQSSIRKVVRAENNNFATGKTFLSSREAHKEFLNLLTTSPDGKTLTRKWKDTLMSNGITGLSFPTAVSAAIETSWNGGKGLFQALRHVSTGRFTIQYTEQDDVSANTLAKGHTVGTDKTAQEIEVQNRLIDLQGIYKDQYVNRVELAQLTDEPTFLNWLVTELSERLQYTIERRIICGGSTESEGLYGISSFEGIGAKSQEDAFTLFYENRSSGTALTDLRNLALQVQNRGRAKWMFIDSTLYSFLTTRLYAEGGSPFVVTKEQFASEMGVDRVELFPIANGQTSGKAVIITPDLYYRVGGEPFGEQSSIWLTNQEAFRAEIFAGGRIAGLKSTAVFSGVTQG